MLSPLATTWYLHHVNNQGLCKFQGSNSSSFRQNLPLVFSNNDKMCRLEMIACSKAENRKQQLLRDDRQCLLGFASNFFT